MVMDAFCNLALSWKSILRTFTGGAESASQTGMEDRSQQIPALWWIGGLIAGAALAAFVSNRFFDIPVWMTLVAVAMSWVLSMIAVRSTGETDINPTGGMGKVTQLSFGAIAPGDPTTNLMAAGITSAGASQAADMMQDLKTGRMIGASPRKQFIAQCLGILAGIPIATAVYTFFRSSYEIGGDEENAPAPAAMAWKAMSELLAQGLDALPEGSLVAVVFAGTLGVALPLLRRWVPSSKKELVPSGLAAGIAFIVPAYYSITIFLGCLMFARWRKKSPDQYSALVFAVASGLVAGEALMSIPNAVLQMLEVPKLTG
jgi:OPT family oligopeptide transporter